MTQHFSAQGHVSHICLGDGSVLRLDLEVGRWRARWYAADMSLMCYACGPHPQMLTVVNGWLDAYLASLTSPLAVVGERAGPVVDFPGPAQTNLPLGETA